MIILNTLILFALFHWIRITRFRQICTHFDNDFGDFVFSFFDWVEITNATDSTQIDFSDGVVGSPPFKIPDGCPGVCLNVVLMHLETNAI